ncbi:50S ribosomal protein L32 [Candidatus Parcubacteria bacterium]|nr:50S ribosomal protein L32 [Patescibacteria group bacterium]MBU4309876.1 50S ribosomal protein L32 [Patescibacteria group bacterium]MBU4431713.1 50S ribosomal protein L32 [Patescibacteria group bacterium]MBU4578215.1 50S ribosomal protein L32 [Patescibacteria group bacterium]MCG2696751.1 50S ribosomal protein L32 [Candidatus Parcubacteria bacterium]
MSVPKKKRTKGHVRNRRSHHALDALVLAKCSKCGKAVEAHAACSFCGNYKGKEILTIKVKTAKEAK